MAPTIYNNTASAAGTVSATWTLVSINLKIFLAWQPQPPQHFHHPDQDTNDPDKCLNQISAPLIIGFGFLDGQIDHTLATCHSVCLPHANPVILLHGKHDLVLYHRTPLTLELPLNTRFLYSHWPANLRAIVRTSLPPRSTYIKPKRDDWHL